MLVLVLMMLCTCVTRTGACSCPPFFGRDRVCGYPVIVRGTAWAEYEEREAPYNPKDPMSVMSPYNDNVYSIVVKQAIKVPDSLKGEKMISFRSPVSSSLCGTRFALDVEAVFFGYINSKGEIRTGICDPNVGWEGMGEDNQKFLMEEVVEFCANPTPDPFIGPPGSRPLPPGAQPLTLDTRPLRPGSQPPGSGPFPPGDRRPWP